MKALRVIKIIAFVLALLVTAVAVAGNVFVIKDAAKYEEQGVTVSSILEELDKAEFKILPEKTASAEEEVEAAPVTDEEAPVTVEETPAATEAPVPTEAPVAAPVEETEPAATEEAYSVNNYHYLIVSMMKAGTYKVELSFLNNVTISGSQPFADNGFQVNLCLLIAFCLLFFCFIFHCISKNCPKTFYGIILMLLGYLLFVFFVCAGMFLANALGIIANSFDQYDSNLIRIAFVFLGIFFGVFFGLPYYRCGSRQMRMKELKQTVKKLKRKYAR